MRADLRALFDDANRDFAAGLGGQLLQTDRGGEAGRPGTDNDHVIFHTLAFDLLALGHRVAPVLILLRLYTMAAKTGDLGRGSLRPSRLRFAPDLRMRSVLMPSSNLPHPECLAQQASKDATCRCRVASLGANLSSWPHL